MKFEKCVKIIGNRKKKLISLKNGLNKKVKTCKCSYLNSKGKHVFVFLKNSKFGEINFFLQSKNAKI